MSRRRRRANKPITVKDVIDATTRQGTTPERLRKANGHTHIENGVQYMRDDTLDRALSRGRLSSSQYEAGKKYRHHWYNAGLAGTLQSCNLHMIGGAEFGAGMPRTENEAFHRQQYRRARLELDQVRFCVDVVEAFILKECGLSEIGYLVSEYRNRPQAEAAASTLLRIGFDILVRHYGL